MRLSLWTTCLFAVVGLVASSGAAEPIPEAYRRIAHETRIPARVLYRLAQTSTQTWLTRGSNQPWPWTLTIEGRPVRFRNRNAAVQALLEHIRYPRISLQVGLMQLDWQNYRRHYIRSPQVLFDPWHNLRLAASELKRHYDDSGRWSLAAARYTGALRTQTLSFRINTKQRRRLSPIIHTAAARHGLPPALIEAVIATESNFNPEAVSPAGARGLMQLMPATARRFGVANPLDPLANIEGGTRYLRWLLDEFAALPLALAGYNAGENAVRKYGHTIPPYPETRRYVPRVLAFYRLFMTEEAAS